MQNDWISESSNKFKSFCNQLQAKLSSISPEQMLDTSDTLLVDFQKLVNEVQQQAIQEQVDIKMPLSSNRNCPCCSRQMRHKSNSKFEFINRSGNIKLTGIYYRCRCGGSQTVGGFVNRGNRLSSQASELLARYGGTLSFACAEKFLRKDFGIFVSDNYVHEHVSRMAGQIKQIRDNRTIPLEWSEIENSQLYGYISHF